MREVTASERSAAPYSRIGLTLATFKDDTRHVATDAIVNCKATLAAWNAGEKRNVNG